MTDVIQDIDLSLARVQKVLEQGPAGPTGPAGPAGGGQDWGTITGTLSDQTDLQAALDAKASQAQAIAYAIALGG